MKPLVFIHKYILQMAITALCAIVLVPAVSAGPFDDFAKFKRIPEMRSYIIGTQALPDYNYYYTGRSHLPYAVIGVDKKFDLNSKFWNKIDTREMVADKVDGLMPTHPYKLSVSRILDLGGKQIGIWFSYYPSTIVKFGQDSNIIVYSPYNPNRFID